MGRLAVVGGALLVAAAGGALALRAVDAQADGALWDDLVDAATAERATSFDPGMVADLPEPAQRFFLFAIAPGTPLRTAARIEMGGELSLGTRDEPNYQPMHAEQILAPPHGFVWKVRTGGTMVVTGSDAMGPDGRWSRFRVLDAVPVGRVKGDADHYRSSLGRMVGEGLFWTPAAFLPAADADWHAIGWEAVDESTARVAVRAHGLEQAADVTVDAAGRPLRVAFQRWSDENPKRTYRSQPFGGELSAFATYEGYTVPTHVIGGNHFGTDLYHPFYRARVTEVRYR